MTELRFDTGGLKRVAVITGGGRGLGRAYALLLASRGCRIVINDIGADLLGQGNDAGPAEELAREICGQGGEAVVNTDSVSTPEGGKAIIAAAIAAFGRIDILIHSAGNTRRGLLTELSYADFEDVLSVHLRGAFHVVREAFPLMMAQGFGRIILTGSINGLYGKANNVNYSLCKAGLMGLAQTAAIEGQHANVQANLIVPAAVTRMSEGIDTSQFPPMDPEMVAPVVAWLAHESCMVSGEMLVAMAGRVARAFMAETPGVFHQHWSIEQVAADAEAIRDTSHPVIFPTVPDGQLEHLLYGFAMARSGEARAGKKPA
jgi:NAD(P)-dependent dehydrogenase (short-subunit alcohol dehydrogenase family)